MKTFEVNLITVRKEDEVLLEETLEKLRSMKLRIMAEAFEEQVGDPQYSELSFEERFGLIVDREWTERRERRLKRRLSEAKLRFEARLEEIEYRGRVGLEKAFVSELGTCQWIRKHLNLIITGPTGVGKTFLSCALAARACELGFRVLSYRTSRLFGELEVARCDGTYLRLLGKLKRIDLLVIDDWGIVALTEGERLSLLEIVEDRYELGSTLICSQVPVSKWYKLIGDPTVADSILDRLIQSSYRIELKGESIRKKKSSSRKKGRTI